MFRRWIALCLLLCLWTVPGRAEAPETTIIVHATDLHYLSPELTDDGALFMFLIESGDGKVVHYSPEIVAAFVDEMLFLQPDAVVLSGDLTFNGEPQSHVELAALLAPLSEAGIDVLALSGNHDSGSVTWSYSDAGYQMIDGFQDERFDDVYAALGYGQAIAQDSISQSYVAEIQPEVRILLVDVNTNGTASTGITGYVRDETLAWIEQQLDAASKAGATVIAVSHQPVLVHNDMFVNGKVIANADRLLALYEKYGVQVNLSGHLHLQHIREQGSLTEFVTGSLSVAPIEYAVLTLKDGKPASYETHALDVAAWAVRNGVDDANLLGFADYAQSFFDRITLSQVSPMLDNMGIPEENAQAMKNLALRLNQEYFAGTRSMHELDQDIELWVTYAPVNFFTLYLSSIIEETTSMNVYVFP